MKVGGYGSGDGTFISPYGIAVDAGGNAYVTDSGNHRIQKFDSDGHYLLQYGSQGSGDGQFQFPTGITVDSGGAIYVADTGNNRVQKLAGTWNMAVGTAGTGSGTITGVPAGLGCAAGVCRGAFLQGTDYTLTATPNPGYRLVTWGGACAGCTGPVCTVGLAADSSCTATFDLMQYLLAVNLVGTGGGSLNSNPSGFSCTRGLCVTGPCPPEYCERLYELDAPLTLMASNGAGSFFAGWSGACGGSGACNLSMAYDRSVIATFTQYSYVRVMGGSDYGTVMAAYANVGAGGTMKARGREFVENLHLDRSVTTTLKGGYDTGFDTNPGWTTVRGTVTIAAGRVVVERLVVR
jgi:hypothetical protein